MRKRLLLYVCLIGLLSCTDSNISIHYKQKVNGYDVSVKILPDSIQEGYFSDIATREAELTFKKDNQELIVKNLYYGDKSLIADSLTNGMTIDYTLFEMSESGTFRGNQSPFFFLDVDFDGEDELLVCLWEEMGYRGYHAYQAYETNVGGGTHQLSPIQDEPFNELNDYTEFDPINKTICIPQGVGLKMEGKKVYGLADGSLTLIGRVQYDWEHTKGVKYEPCKPTIYHYKIVNGTEILDRIERCPNDK